MHSFRNADLRLVGLVERVASATLTFGLELGCPESGSYSGRDYSQPLLSLAAKPIRTIEKDGHHRDEVKQSGNDPKPAMYQLGASTHSTRDSYAE